MLTIFGFKISYEALAFLALFLASEVIGVSKLRDNSVAQFIVRVATALKPFRSEDEKIEKLKKVMNKSVSDAKDVLK